MKNNFSRLGALYCGLAIALGAFAAHGLKETLGEYGQGLFHTATLYALVHGLALLIIPTTKFSESAKKHAQILLLIGVPLFSGSLYILGWSGIRAFGMITPLGGLCFLAAWARLVFSGRTSPSQHP